MGCKQSTARSRSIAASSSYQSHDRDRNGSVKLSIHNDVDDQNGGSAGVLNSEELEYYLASTSDDDDDQLASRTAIIPVKSSEGTKPDETSALKERDVVKIDELTKVHTTNIRGQKKHELVPGTGINIIVTPVKDHPQHYLVSIENTTNISAHVALDFNHHIGVHLIPRECTERHPFHNELFATLLPKSTSTLAEMLLTNANEDVSPVATVKFRTLDEEVNAVQSKQNQDTIKQEYEHFERTLQLHGLNVWEASDNAQHNEQILSTCKSLQIPFLDTTFPPGLTSWRGAFELAENPNQDVVHESISVDVMWIRGRTVLMEACLPYDASPSSEDIEPCSHNRGWLLCALALIVDEFDLLLRIFPTEPLDEEIGAYRFRSTLTGWSSICILDDYVPCGGSLQQFLFSRARTGHMWVSIAEKAFAKAYGGYCMLQKGSVAYALTDLVGFPTRKVLLHANMSEEDSIEIWELVVNSLQEGYIVGIGTKQWSEGAMSASESPLSRAKYEFDDNEHERDPDVNALRNYGFLSGFTYSVLEAVESVTGEKLLNLRLPHWSCDWKVDTTEAEDTNSLTPRTVWLSLQDSMNLFTAFTICHYAPSYNNVRIEGKFETGESLEYLSLHVRRTSVIFLTLRQLENVSPMASGDETLLGSIISPSNTEHPDESFYSSLVPIGFFILTCHSEHEGYQVMHFTGLERTRENFCTLELPESDFPYLMIPIVGVHVTSRYVWSIHYAISGFARLRILHCVPEITKWCNIHAIRKFGVDYPIQSMNKETHNVVRGESSLIGLRTLQRVRWLGCLLYNDHVDRTAFVKRLDLSQSVGYHISSAPYNHTKKGIFQEIIEIPPQSQRWAFILCSVSDCWRFSYTLNIGTTKRRSLVSSRQSSPQSAENAIYDCKFPQILAAHHQHAMSSTLSEKETVSKMIDTIEGERCVRIQLNDHDSMASVIQLR